MGGEPSCLRGASSPSSLGNQRPQPNEQAWPGVGCEVAVTQAGVPGVQAAGCSPRGTGEPCHGMKRTGRWAEGPDRPACIEHHLWCASCRQADPNSLGC